MKRLLCFLLGHVSNWVKYGDPVFMPPEEQRKAFDCRRCGKPRWASDLR